MKTIFMKHTNNWVTQNLIPRMAQADGLLESNSWILPTLVGTAVLLAIITLALLWYLHQRRQAVRDLETALQQSEMRYHQISSVISDYVYAFAVNPDGSLELDWVTGKFKQITGYSPEESEQQGGWGNLIHPDDLPIAVNRGERISQGHQEITEFRIIRADGEIRWLRDHGHPILDQDSGKVIRILGAVEDITEHKLAEESQRETNEKFRILYNNSPDMHVSVSPKDGTILECNKTLLQKTDYTREEVIGSPIFKMYHEDCMEQVKETFNQFVQTGIVQNKELTLQRKDGSKIEVSLNVNALKDEQGNILHSLSSWRDITEQKLTEQALKESAERLRLSTEVAGVAIWETDILAKKTHRTPNHDSLFGLEPQQNWGLEPFLRSVHPDDREYVGQNIQEPLTPGGPDKHTFDFRVIWPDETIHWLTVIGDVAERDENGNGLIARGIVVDITDRKQVEQALKQSEEKYYSITENAGALISEMDANGRILYANPEHELILGYTPYELINGEINFGHPDEADDAVAAFTQLLTEREPSDNIWRFQHKNGEWRWFRCLGNTYISSQGDPRVIVASYDITKRKQAEEALRESQERFERAMEATQDGLYDWNLVTNKIYFSPSWKSMLGYDYDELPNDFSVWETLTEPEDVKKSWVMQQQLINKERDRFELEFKMKHKDGHWVDILSRAYAIFDENDVAVRIVGTHVDISERKQIEEELRNQKEMFELVINSAPTRIFWKDTNSVYLGSNISFAKAAGEDDVANIIGKRDIELIWGNEAQKFIDDDTEVIETGIPRFGCEEHYTTPDGQKIWWRTSKMPLKDGDGNIFGVIATSEDFTERKLAEEARRESEQQLQAIFDNSLNSIMVADDAGNYLNVNQSAADMFGYTVEQLLQMNVGDLRTTTAPDAAERYQTYVKNGFEIGEFDFVRPDGQWGIAQYHAVRVGDNFNLSVLSNITERKHAEAALKESEEKFRAIFEQSPMAIQMYDKEGILIDVNQQTLDTYGLKDKKHFLGYSMWNSPNFTPDHIKTMQNGQSVFISASLDFDAVKEANLFPTEKSGIIYLDMYILPLIQEEEITGFLVQFVDVTERKTAEEELVQAHNLLEEGQKIAHLGIFEYIVAPRTTVWSEEEYRIYGLDPSAPSPDYDVMLNECIHPEDRELLHNTFMEAIKSQSVYALEHRIVWSDGTVRWVYDRAHPYFDSNGELVRYIGVTLDITERKEAEAALRLNEQRLRLSIESSGIAVWEYDFVQNQMSRSANHDQLYGLDRQDIWVLDTFLNAAHPEDRNRSYQLILAASQPNGPDQYSFDFRVIWPDESVHWLSVFGEVSDRDEAGNAIMIRGTIFDITSRKEVEEARLISEKRYKELFDDSPVPLWEEDFTELYAYFAQLRAEGVIDFRAYFDAHPEALQTCAQKIKITDVNRASVELHKANNKEELLVNIADTFTENTYDVFKEELIALTEGHLAFEAELEVKTLDGDPIDLFMKVLVDRDNQGTMRALLATTDITDRKRMESALKESEERYRLLVEMSPDGIFLHRDGKVIYANNAGVRLLGYSTPEAMIGLPIQNVVHPDNWQQTMKRAERMMAGEQGIYPAEDIYMKLDGTAVPIEVTVTQVTYQGETAVLVIARDNTERKQAKEALQKSEEKFRGIFEQSPIGIQIFDKNGRLIDTNQQTLNIFGIDDKKHLLGYDMWADPNTTEEKIEAIQNGHSIFIDASWDFDSVRSNNLFPTRNTGMTYLDLHAIPLMSEGTITGYLVHLLDVTERKKMQAQLLQAQKMEAIGRLAGGIAHDFNNVLVPIIGHADLGMLRLNPEDKLYSNLKRIVEAAERAASLVHQILAFSRKQMLEMKVVNLNVIVREFNDMLQRLIGENIEFQAFLEPNLDPINADKGQIEQVLMNLAINARDAMPDGGHLTIETANIYLDKDYVSKYVDAQEPGHYVMIAVSDTGDGMDAKTREQIFEPFFTTKEIGKGTGLGLSTVFGIIKQHGGNIWVYSEPEKGTTFKIYLPRVESLDEVVEPQANTSATMYGSETILVVEDEALVRQLVCETLIAHGYKVLEAENPQEGMLHASENKNKIHLLLTDVILPEMNGKLLYQNIVDIDPAIKVLYMSGYTDNVIVHHGMLDKGVNFLQKPFTVQSLTQMVRRVLNQND